MGLKVKESMHALIPSHKQNKIKLYVEDDVFESILTLISLSKYWVC